jgi:DNA-binding transcriptional ArsR family regulator
MSVVADALEVEEFPEPVTHGAGISFNVEETALYDDARELWQSEIGDPEHEPLFIPYDPDFVKEERANSDGFGLRFTSSGWKAGMETGTNGYRQWYEYELTLRERVTSDGRTKWKEPLGTSLNINIQPQVEGLVYKDGNDLSLPYGEGTKVWVQTTYPDGPEDMVERTTNALEACFDGYQYAGYVSDSARITKLETHVRFDIEAKNRAIETLMNTKRLISYGGSAEIDIDEQRLKPGWKKSKITTDRWDLLGFDSAGFDELLKIYQIGGWHTRPADDPLGEPKMEAAYQGGDDAHPPLSAWSDLTDRLSHKVVQHCRWAGIEPDDLVADPHYAGSDAPTREYPVLEGRRDDLRAYYDNLNHPVIQEVRKPQTRGPFDILSVVLEQSGADYDTLVSETGLSRSTVQYHVARFEELGFIERVGNPTWVFFEAPYVEEIVRDVVEGFAPDTVSGKRIERAKRANERRNKREGEEVEVDAETDERTEQAARALFRYIEEVDITPEQLSTLIAQGDLTERDVRVRWSEDLEEKAIG